MKVLECSEKKSVIEIDGSEVRLIMKSLDRMHESAFYGTYGILLMNESARINLAGLKEEWRILSQDIAAGRDKKPASKRRKKTSETS